MNRPLAALTLPLVWALAACSQPADTTSSAASSATTVVTVEIPALAETVPVEAALEDDAADDPAIWRNPADPAQSLIIGTDKKGGVYVYGLDGSVKSFVPSAGINNIDLLTDVTVNGAPQVLVAASNRSTLTEGKMSVWTLNTTTGALTAIGDVPSGAGEAYGFCLHRDRSDGAVYGFVVNKEGSVAQIRLDLTGPQVKGSVVRTLKVQTQPEGCVVDGRTGRFYLGEETVGIWSFDAAPTGSTEGTLIARIDGQQLVADVEGLALAPAGASGGYLIASSQGDNAYAVYNLETNAYVGRLRIGDGANGLGGAQETDGIELALGDFGPTYPEGLFVAQDGENKPRPQNFKMASWKDIRAALKLN